VEEFHTSPYDSDLRIVLFTSRDIHVSFPLEVTEVLSRLISFGACNFFNYLLSYSTTLFIDNWHRCMRSGTRSRLLVIKE
jgi:hypothetical protein